jgi:hypothetical protein
MKVSHVVLGMLVVVLVAGVPLAAAEKPNLDAIEKTLAALAEKGLTLLAVQGKDEFKITTVEELQAIADSGIETVFFLVTNESGARRKVAALPASDTGKSAGSWFWKKACQGAGICQSCSQFFNENMCK